MHVVKERDLWCALSVDKFVKRLKPGHIAFQSRKFC